MLSRTLPVPVTAVRKHRLRVLGRLLALLGCLLGLLLVVGAADGAGSSSAHKSAAKHKSKPKPTVAGWLGNGAGFPSRAMVLSATGVKLGVANVQVTENGGPVSSVTVSSAAEGKPGDFGTVVLLDNSRTSAGGPFAAAIGAVRSLAGHMTGAQQLGVSTFNSTPAVLLNPTSDRSIISKLSPPSGAAGSSNPPAALSLATAELAHIKVALGAIILISDGAGVAGSAGAAQAAAHAASLHIPIFTVGLQDARATAASLHALSLAAPGQFIKATPSNLNAVVKQIYSTVARAYVVRWRSNQKPRQNVAVSLTVKGVPGAVTASYRAPVAPSTHLAPAPTPTAPHPHPSATAHLSLTSQLRGASADQLSPLPSFARETPSTPARAADSTHQGFWASSAAVPAIALLCGVLIALTVAFGLYRPSQRAVRTRVESFIPGPIESADPLSLGHGGDQTKRGLFRAIEHGTWWPPFVEDVEVSRNPRTPVQLVQRAAAAGVGLALVLYLLAGSMLLALVPLLGWPFALRMAVKRSAQKQREKFKDVLPGYLQDLASAMRVGRSFVSGISAVVETADEPVRSELEHAVADEALGRPLEESLEAVALRMQAPDMDQVALIAGLNRRTGSNVAESLDRVAEGARDRADLRREMKALTGQARMSSLVLTALPGVLLLGVNLISPLYAYPLFHTTLGIVLLCIGACMVLGGWKVMKKITDVEP